MKIDQPKTLTDYCVVIDYKRVICHAQKEYLDLL